MSENTYNGWRNYETWNVALWLGNDEGLYRMAEQFRRCQKPYDDLVEELRALGNLETPDHVAYNDSGLDRDALNDLIREF